MPKKGDQARESVKNTIIEAFNATGNFVAFLDKKIYVQAEDGANGGMVQFAITMTMPKTPVEAGAQTTAGPVGNGFSTNSGGNALVTPTELSPEDKEQVEKLKEKLRAAGVYQE